MKAGCSPRCWGDRDLCHRQSCSLAAWIMMKADKSSAVTHAEWTRRGTWKGPTPELGELLQADASKEKQKGSISYLWSFFRHRSPPFTFLKLRFGSHPPPAPQSLPVNTEALNAAQMSGRSCSTPFSLYHTLPPLKAGAAWRKHKVCRSSFWSSWNKSESHQVKDKECLEILPTHDSDPRQRVCGSLLLLTYTKSLHDSRRGEITGSQGKWSKHWRQTRSGCTAAISRPSILLLHLLLRFEPPPQPPPHSPPQGVTNTESLHPLPLIGSLSPNPLPFRPSLSVSLDFQS